MDIELQAKVKLDRFREAARQRMKQALELRLAGARYDVIAEQLGYASPSGACMAVQRALKEIPAEPAARVREQEIARIDAVLLAIWPQVKQGVLAAVDRFIKLSQRRSMLLGLDMPQKVALTDPTGEKEYEGKSDSELIEEFERIIEQARKNLAKVESDTRRD